MKESEFKYLINLDSYTEMCNRLKSNYEMQRLLQINYYFDTENNELEQNDITFRVRQKEANLTIQIKTPISKEGHLSIKNEFHEDIDHLPLLFDKKQTSIIEALSPYAPPFFLKGMLVTERNRCFPENEVKVDLDKSYYLGIIDYELEIEFNIVKKKAVEAFLNSFLGNSVHRPLKGKRERFFEHFKQLSLAVKEEI